MIFCVAFYILYSVVVVHNKNIYYYFFIISGNLYDKYDSAPAASHLEIGIDSLNKNPAIMRS